MIHAGNLNNSCTDRAISVMATGTVNLGQITSPLVPRQDQIVACQPEPSKICPMLTPQVKWRLVAALLS